MEGSAEQRKAAPKGWKQTQAPDGRPYWYNAATGETSWQPPGGGPGPTLQLEGSSVELLQVRAFTHGTPWVRLASLGDELNRCLAPLV